MLLHCRPGGLRIKHQPAFLADVSHQIVKRIHRHQRIDAIAVIAGGTATDGEAWSGIDKAVCQAGDGVNRNAGLLCHRVGRVIRKCVGPGAKVGAAVVALGDDVVCQTQCQDTFGARLGRNPLIGGGATDGHPRFDLYKASPDIGSALAALAKAEAVMYR